MLFCCGATGPSDFSGSGHRGMPGDASSSYVLWPSACACGESYQTFAKWLLGHVGATGNVGGLCVEVVVVVVVVGVEAGSQFQTSSIPVPNPVPNLVPSPVPNLELYYSFKKMHAEE